MAALVGVLDWDALPKAKGGLFGHRYIWPLVKLSALSLRLIQPIGGATRHDWHSKLLQFLPGSYSVMAS